MLGLDQQNGWHLTWSNCSHDRDLQGHSRIHSNETTHFYPTICSAAKRRANGTDARQDYKMKSTSTRKSRKENSSSTSMRPLHQGSSTISTEVQPSVKLQDSDLKSTRICIKNVPLSFTENQLREHVQHCGNNGSMIITDCKILKTKSGRHRRLAFVGFKTYEMASHAVQYFHNSYALTSKLSVELAFTKKATPVTNRPWKPQCTLPQDLEKMTETTTTTTTTTNPIHENKNNSTRREEEYLSSVSLQTRPKFWTNNDAGWTETTESREMNHDDVQFTDDDQDQHQQLTIQPTHKLGQNNTGSDMDFLKSKIVMNFDHDDGGDAYPDDDSSSSSAPSSSSSSQDTETKDIEEAKTGSQELSSTRLFIRNLPFSATDQDLREAFLPFGSIVDAIVPLDNTNRNFGYGFIQFANPDCASKALEEMDGSDFQGRLLHVLPARVRESDHSGEAENEQAGLAATGTFKGEKEKQRQANAINSSVGWSTSFIRSDTVVDNLADRLGLSKGDILNVKDGLSAGDAAIRLALGETQILEENREFFKSHGVDMDLIYSKKNATEKMSEDNIPRSNTMILVKNLPYDTSLDEITKMFHRPIGANPKKVMLPPSKTLALVQYEQSYIAKRAFASLAYKRFKNVPLYLEWAPLLSTVPEECRQSEISSPMAVNVSEVTHIQAMDLEEDPNLSASNSTTLFIKNLNFSTTEADVKELFEGVAGNIRAVRIPMKALPTRKGVLVASSVDSHTPPTPNLSMGYGFVEFPSSEAAIKAMKSLQGHMLHGHMLEIKISSSAESGKKPTSSSGHGKNKKLMIRNVPFEASRGELLQLFGSFGQLKSVRLPKKFDGGHRGFAFVEFLSTDEARAAMDSLLGTHLYGRHLVVEWADDKDDVETLRQKAQEQQEAILTSKVAVSKNKSKTFR